MVTSVPHYTAVNNNKNLYIYHISICFYNCQNRTAVKPPVPHRSIRCYQSEPEKAWKRTKKIRKTWESEHMEFPYPYSYYSYGMELVCIYHLTFFFCPFLPFHNIHALYVCVCNDLFANKYCEPSVFSSVLNFLDLSRRHKWNTR